MYKELSAIARRAGDIILSADVNKAELEVKSGPGDFVTEYDKAVQEMLCAELKKLLPEADFIGEETGIKKKCRDGYWFIVDPIDGTTNFAWNYRHSAVSIGLAYKEKMVMGLVYNPYTDEMFFAESGKGAWLNGKQIYASKRSLKSGLVLFGTSPYDKNKADATFALAKLLYDNSLDIRRSGSAALDICYIACGRCELYYELMLSPWDYAAASIIASEAGAIITTLHGESLQFNDKTSVLAAGSKAYDDFWSVYKSLEK